MNCDEEDEFCVLILQVVSLLGRIMQLHIKGVFLSLWEQGVKYVYLIVYLR